MWKEMPLLHPERVARVASTLSSLYGDADATEEENQR